MCLYVLVCDYLPLCVFYSGLVDFGLEWYFGHFVSNGKLVILLEGIFGNLVRMIIFIIKLLVSWVKYLEMVNIGYFSGLSE